MELPANLEPDAAWHEIRAELRRVLGESTYEIWIAPLEVRTFSGNVLLLQAPPDTRVWISRRFGRILESCAKSVLGTPVQVAIEGIAEAGFGSEPPHAHPPDNLNPRYSFEQFIIGEGNRLAHGASLAVAELPGQAYNPLFLHAPPGLGKTHLLHAIGNYVTAFGGSTRVRYTTVEAFTNHFIKSLGARSLDDFKATYRHVDVLLIDDVQFLASKAKTEEEFFHTFNALYENGRQLVLTCDRLPGALTAVEERLRERFEAGLVADIQPPDFDTRVAILRKRAMLDRVSLTDEAVLDLIAERVTENVRALEGALIRIVAYHSLTARPVTLELAQTVLDTMYPRRARSLTVGGIQAAVAAHYEIAVSEMLSANRAARINWPRQVAIYLVRELTTTPLQSIGEAFGGRNHATVLHACRKVSDRLADDQQTNMELAELKDEISRCGDDRSN